MRMKSMILLMPVTMLLLAESQPGAPGQLIEVRANISPVEITGSEVDRVQVNDSSHATINNLDGRVVIESVNSPLKLEAPRRSSLEVVTSNGAIHVSGVTGGLHLTTSNGAITVRDAGSSEIRAHTSNGPIEIGVPASLNANLSARTRNGQIHADTPVVASRTGATFLEGKIGNGGPGIDLQTSNGSIYLRRDGQQESVNSIFKPGEVK
jgi:DUF4097 and DUF4098 domain-containing protein YvlB